MIPNLVIPSSTLEHFNFKTKAETENKYYELLADGALTGYLIAELINAIRNVVSALLSSTIHDLIPNINDLLQHPAKLSTIHTTDYYNKPQLNSFVCDFTYKENTLAVSSLLDFPDILCVDIKLSDSQLFFPKIKYYDLLHSISSTNDSEQIRTKPFPDNMVITFLIWINLINGSSVKNISLPDNYVLLDNELAFPSELESLTSDKGKSTVYVFPIRISNVATVGIADIQISYAYRFIAGNTDADTVIKQEELSGVIDTTTEIVTNNIENT